MEDQLRRTHRASLLLLGGVSLLAVVLGAVMLSRLLDNGTIGMPVLLEPADGAVLTTLSPIFRWRTTGASQIEFEAMPDEPAPAISFIKQDQGNFAVPSPNQWCCLRPDVVYRWRMRATDSPIALTHDDPYWGPWSPQRSFIVSP